MRSAIIALVLALLFAGCGSSTVRNSPRLLSQGEAIESACGSLHTRLNSIVEQNGLRSRATFHGPRSIVALTKASEESAVAVGEARTELLHEQDPNAVRSLAEVMESYARFTAAMRHANPPTLAAGIRLHRIYSALKAEALLRCTSLGGPATLQ
jgi:hypothetical protein